MDKYVKLIYNGPRTGQFQVSVGGAAYLFEHGKETAVQPQHVEDLLRRKYNGVPMYVLVEDQAVAEKAEVPADLAEIEKELAANGVDKVKTEKPATKRGKKAEA